MSWMIKLNKFLLYHISDTIVLAKCHLQKNIRYNNHEQARFYSQIRRAFSESEYTKYINNTDINTMKLQCSVILLVIFKVVSSYPSSDTDTDLEKLFTSFEIINPAVGIPSPYLDDAHISSEIHFPDVEYPTKMLVDTIEPFFYRGADHDDILAPFTNDVKKSYKSLEADRKVKENSAHEEDCSVSPTEFNIQHSIKESEGSKTSDSLFYQVESENVTSFANTSGIGTSETNNYSQDSNEEEVEAIKDISSGSLSDDTNIEPVPTDTTEASDATQDNPLESKHSDEVVSLHSEDEENL